MSWLLRLILLIDKLIRLAVYIIVPLFSGAPYDVFKKNKVPWAETKDPSITDLTL